MKPRDSNEWWSEGFGKGYYPLPSIASAWKRKTRDEVAAIDHLLDLPHGAGILDVGCGVGRHSVALAKLGYEVTGVDISPVYLRQARSAAERAGASARFVRGDMRNLAMREAFDGAINLFSSFGYFSSARDDERVLRNVHRALRPGGKLVVEMVNLAFIREKFLPQSWSELPDGTLMLESRQPVTSERISETRWLFIDRRGRRREMKSSIRLYDAPLLSRLFRKAGFRKVEAFGSLSGESYRGSRSARLVVVGRKG